MLGTRGGVFALVVGLVALALLAGQGGASSTPQLLLLDPVGVFSSPTYVTSPPGDASRIFVVEKGGRIRLVRGGTRQSQPFLTVASVSFREGTTCETS